MFKKAHPFIYLFIILVSVLQVRARGAGMQDALDKKITIQLKNVILKDALEKISNLAEVSFVYVGSDVLDGNKVSINARNEKVGDLLHKLLTPYSLSFSVLYGRIVIKHDNSAKTVSLTETNILRQIVLRITDARGVVINEKGEPVPGVIIIVKGSSRGTSTDDKGEFEMKRVPNDATLLFNYSGYRVEEIKMGEFRSGPLTVLLREKPTRLQEVVVTGFQQIERGKFTGAATRLKSEDAKINGVTDVSRMLEGRIAGVAIQNVSGTFGSAPKVRIRGATSINGDNKPLWVVDGVILEDVVNISNDQLSSGDPATLLGSAIAGLNANDIESFDILKDAAATALYGARAMNGVVVITTRKGRPGKPVITYNGNFSTQLKPAYANFNIMNSGQQMSVLAELERKGILTSDILSQGDIGVFGKLYEQLDADGNGNFPVENDPERKRAFLLRYAKANTDWFNLLFRNNFVQEHSLSIASGTDRAQSYFSAGFFSDNGWTLADRVTRYTLNYRNNYSFGNRLTAGFSALASVRRQKAPGALTRSSNPVEGRYDRDFDINPFSYALNTSRTLTAYDEAGNLEYFRRNYAPFNILNELRNNYLDLNMMDVRLQGDLAFRLSRHLRYEFMGAIRYVKSSREHQITENANMANAYRAAGNATIAQNNKFLYRDPDDPDALPVIVLPSGGFYNRTEDQLLNYDFRNNLNYTDTFGTKHHVNVLIGQQVKYADRQNASSTGYGYQYENGGNALVDYRILKQMIESNFPYYGMARDYDRFAAFYVTGTYAYNNKYNLTATARYDGSNRLGQSRKARWLPTWTLAGSWNLGQENFAQRMNNLDYLTLRASYGLTASMGPATNSNIVYQAINTKRPHLSEVESVISLAHLQNDELTWEKLYTTNIGLDGGFYNGRLNFSIDAYSRKSFDLISIIKTSGIGGEMYKAANYADLSSKGVEIMMSGDIVRKKDWGWRTNLTFGYSVNKITYARNIPGIFDLVVAEGGSKEGYPVRGLFSLQYTGLNPKTGVPSFINEHGQNSPDVYLQDLNTAHLVYAGPVDPPVTGGFSNTFRYKSLSLNVFFTYQWGNKIRLYPAFKTSYSDLDAMPKEFYDRWVMPGDQHQTHVPSMLDAYEKLLIKGAFPYNNYNYSTERVAKGDFIRLKTVSLTYQLPVALVQRAGFSSVAVSGTAINPWLICADPKLQGQDPEFFNAGGVAQPIQKQFTISIKAGI
ncbi:SusC/RagA family TonB-linked outer membrane protein [Chitinophaga nivalis]|uniref:SusC/RagA family TonB-linked outer membrane protein n=1 Tax=Chitinophaga nivalis TaxID=2991709 RepID=A0ABT3IFH4_9BACT|nr:SusC/RagA family TonB-linked outer membrane protein [Chitinophaga nivalis]MCW3467605.1 SusC/RagA family TonB-linked outer membrane protein [Chitinophaga nivalis]MCW3482703.1 SusC/RagA family TonB-linked outer membrane protein [Chitinophaga nivalis]